MRNGRQSSVILLMSAYRVHLLVCRGFSLNDINNARTASSLADEIDHNKVQNDMGKYEVSKCSFWSDTTEL